MKYSIGKLLVAPEKPSSTLEVFVTDEDKVEDSGLGSLFVLAEINSREKGVRDKVRQLIEMIKNDYYASPTPDVETSLETTCQNLNLNFADVMQKPEAWYEKVNMLVGVTYEDVLTFSQMGSFSGYLIRGTKVSSILDTQKNDPTDELFSQLTTGEVKAGDVVVLADYTLFDFFSLEKIKKVTTKLNPEQAVHQFKNLFLENVRIPETVGVVIKYEKSRLAVEETDETQKYIQELYGSQESMQQLENLKERTGRTLSSSMWPNMDKVKKSLDVGGKVKSIFSKKNGSKRALKLPKEKSTKAFEDDEVLAPLDIGAPKPIKGLNVPKVKLPHLGGSMKWLIIVLIVIFAGSLVYLNFHKKFVERREANATILELVEDKKSRAEAALIYQDEEKANELLVEARQDLEDLDQYNDEWVEEYEKVLQDLQRRINKVNDIFEVEAEVVADLINIDISSINEMLKQSEMILVLVDNNKVYKVDAGSKSFSEFFSHEDLKDLSILEDEGIVLQTIGNEFYLRGGDVENLLSFSLPAENKIDDMKTYGSRIYYLDSERGIYKVTSPLSAKPEVAVWYDEDKDLITGVKDILIDGNIWLNSTQGIIKLFKGAREDFEITKLDKNMGQDLEIYTETDWDNLYMVDKFNRRLLVVDKSGVVVQQFLADELSSAENLVVSDNQSVAWFASGGKVWEISLSSE